MQKNYGIKFLGIGSALPKKVVKNTDLEKLYDTSDEWIIQRTGIKERRVVQEGKESGLSLSKEAALKALKQANVDPNSIDLIIVATCTPDNLYPSMACMLQGEIGSNNAVGFDLSAACSGFIYGIVTASQFIYNGVYENVLVVGVDIHSRFLDWSDRQVSVLFGDGAGAVLMSSCLARDDEIIAYLMQSEADKNLDLLLENRGIFYPMNGKDIKPNFVCMNGRVIYEFGVKIVPEVVIKLLDKTNFKLSDIDYLIPHQANQRIIEAAAKRLGLKKAQVISNIEKVGNTSSASIPIALKEALDLKAVKVPSKMIWVGFGAGLTWGALLVDWKLS